MSRQSRNSGSPKFLDSSGPVQASRGTTLVAYITCLLSAHISLIFLKNARGRLSVTQQCCMTQNNSVYNEIQYSPDYPLVIQQWKVHQQKAYTKNKSAFFTRYLMTGNPISQLVQIYEAKVMVWGSSIFMEKRHIRKHLWKLQNNFILSKNKGLRYTQIYNCAQNLKKFHQKLSIPEIKKRFLVTKETSEWQFVLAVPPPPR